MLGSGQPLIWGERGLLCVARCRAEVPVGTELGGSEQEEVVLLAFVCTSGEYESQAGSVSMS